MSQNSATRPLMSEGRTSVLGAALSMLGPISLSLYTPAMPALTEAFATTDAAIKLSLSFYFGGFAFAMLATGPLSDAFGRRRTVVGFLALYLLGSIMAAFAGGVPMLLAGRLVQGINEHQPQSLILVPELALTLVSAAEQKQLDSHSFRFLAVGGGRVSSDLLARGRAVGLPSTLALRVVTTDGDNFLHAVHTVLATEKPSRPLVFVPAGRAVSAEVKLLQDSGLPGARALINALDDGIDVGAMQKLVQGVVGESAQELA